MKHATRLTAFLIVAIVAVPRAIAQKYNTTLPPGAAKLSPAAVAESLVVLNALHAAVRKNPYDATLWYRRGLVAWALATRDAAGPHVKAIDWTRLGRMADTSLRIAAHLAPDSVEYLLSIARYLMASGSPMARYAAKLKFEHASNVALESPDPRWRGETALERGRIHWLRYESFAHRRLETKGVTSRSVTQAMSPLAKSAEFMQADAFKNLMRVLGDAGASPGEVSDARSTLETITTQFALGAPQFDVRTVMDGLNQVSIALPFSVQGESDYLIAESYFRQAYDALPAHEQTFRSVAMMLIERRRWTEARLFSRSHLARAPWDAWAWLTLGLAEHRLYDETGATAAFDSALRLLPPEDRQRMDNLERLLSPVDEARLATSADDVRNALNVRFWLMHDQLWSIDHDSPRIEFLARVAYSELRWSVPELGLHGADSDRGDIHIRYGPPDLIYALPPNPILHNANVAQFWSYKIGLVFAFWGAPTFGTMNFPSEDRSYVNAMTAQVPVRWDNLDNHVRIDTLPFRFARFRSGDSVDVVIATKAPVDSIQRSGVVRGPVQSRTWLLRNGIGLTMHDSTEASASAPNFVMRRVAPGWYTMRAEATQRGSAYAATTTARIVAEADSASGFALHGVGMSDLLLATGAAPLRERTVVWRDFDLVPLAGAHSRATPLALIWETYGLADSAGHAVFEVAVTFERERGRAGRILARVLNRVADAVRTDDAGNRMTMRFDRTAPAGPSIAQAIPIGVAETPPGIYRVTVEITDRITGTSLSRTTRVEIRE